MNRPKLMFASSENPESVGPFTVSFKLVAGDQPETLQQRWASPAAKATAPAGPVPRDGGSNEIRFGGCRLLPGARTLLRDGRPVVLGSRAFDLLHLLLMSRGAIVTKAAIVSHVWPHTIVEESNLRFQIAALRRSLGPERHLVKTVPGRGYLFAEDLAAPSAQERE
jgi:DNA-binding winged helix-turn-helix (wHTH) protein